MLPHLRDHELEACFVMELLDSTAILYGFWSGNTGCPIFKIFWTGWWYRS
jgi:hypothetical protein